MDRIHQSIDGRHGVFFRDIGQVGVSCGSRWTGMAEGGLDMAKTQPPFK